MRLFMEFQTMVNHVQTEKEKLKQRAYFEIGTLVFCEWQSNSIVLVFAASRWTVTSFTIIFTEKSTLGTRRKNRKVKFLLCKN